MANENVRNALRRAGLQPDELADLLEVDVKTVRRWIYGNRPHPRQRVRVARALDTPEHELWPEPATPDPRAQRADRPVDVAPLPVEDSGRDLYSDLDFLALIDAARQRIDIVLGWWDYLLDSDEILAALEAKHAAGCQVRVVKTDPDQTELEERTPGFAYQELEEFEHAFSIHRYDEEMVIALRWFSRDPERDTLPVIRLNADDAGGAFARFAAHLDLFWIDPDPDLENGVSDEPDRELQDDPPEEPPGRSRASAPDASGAVPRFWPGRRPDAP